MSKKPKKDKKDDKELVDEKISSKIPETKKTPEINVDLSDSKKLQELIEKNIKWSQVIYEQNKKIKRRLTWMVVGSYFRLALVLIPLILAIFYLPPLIEKLIDQYNGLLGGFGSTSQIGDFLGNVSNSQIEEILNKVNFR